MSKSILMAGFFLVMLGVALFVVFLLTSIVYSLMRGAPYIPTKKRFMKEILDFGGLSEQDVFYELGSGDGRVLVTAAEDFNVSNILGCELSPWPYFKARFLIWRHGLGKRIHLQRKNLMEIDLAPATFLYLYLYTPLINKRLAYKMARELRAGAKIVSCSVPLDLSLHPQFHLTRSQKIGPVHVYCYEKK